ncbi:hypothetical protein HCN44_003877 [Aphidius gifuensis]|uniref:BMP-binding endothelial regulator protein n=1 Tax=Aphidius gifuensis TaxID=684658 RepID=A0A834XYJ0_APHGI|nr:BMP-binding endothelial regulator protein [Aphidius gifuensis]KAF7994405.1 hypothetical protein HCN44_003877 [Aphidius gifuensis]
MTFYSKKNNMFFIVRSLILALICMTILQCCDAAERFINGDRQTCDIEGEVIVVKADLNPNCYSCICKNGFVECLHKHHCSSVEGCYDLLDGKTDHCCQTCRGCFKNGIEYESGAEWTEPDDPCRVYSCKAGIITESEQHCYTPCANPLAPPPGQCCPVCHGCFVNGQKVTADRSVTTAEDPCVTCKCNGSRLTCSKQACPVLSCPFEKRVNVSSECCPHCIGKGSYFAPPKGACLIGGSIHNSGTQFSIDDDTRCLCIAGSVSCVRETCPALECPLESQMEIPGRRCKQCPVIEESRASCTYSGKTYEDGQTWNLDSCKACECKQGKVLCAMPMCPPVPSPCPANTRLEHPKGQCCPRCSEVDGICTVFGDPHYKTFDGKFFSFKGACKYQLVNDCAGRSFSIRVTNDARSTKSSSWTKTIALKMDGVKLNLGQKMRIKINGSRVSIPYSIPNLLDINKTDDSVLVTTHLGIKILWDGISFIEVTAPTAYRGRLCGLCGNFNLQTKDDFTSRRGQLLTDANLFGKSWTVGSKKMCSKIKQLDDNDNDNKQCRRKKDQRLCNRLKSSIFSACHKKVNTAMYYKSCLQDTCECPNGNCHCQSFVAYVHECNRLGIKLPDWRSSTKCHTVWDMHALATKRIN